MEFIRNIWYVAGWANEFGRDLTARTICNEDIVFYRKQSGELAAIQDRCPHRFAPLSAGNLKGDVVECGYHGLCFDASGDCTFNPHGNQRIPPSAKVKSYKMVERDTIAWIWMGEPAEADESLIVDFSFITKPEWKTVSSYLHVEANYELITDNLLDLSHAQYLHPLFANRNGKPADLIPEENPSDHEVWAYFHRKNQFPSKLMSTFGYPEDQPGDSRIHIRWSPPCVLYLDLGMTGVDRPIEDGMYLPFAHLLTPETESTTHYFWSITRSYKPEDPKLDELSLTFGHTAFIEEDKPMIEMQQKAMKTHDLMSLKPTTLSTDAPSMRARMLVKKKLNAEKQAAAASKVAAE